MSTAVFPLGMKSMHSSGYNHKSTYYNKQYITWKGTGLNSFPIGSATGHIRPLTNKDSGNVFPTGFGLPRPIKHFRKGRVILSQTIPIGSDFNDPSLINYNINRFVKSSKGTTLGGGGGGSGLLNDMQDKPGAFFVKENNLGDANIDCQNCQSIKIVSNYKPNNRFLEENPIPITQNSTLCCNDEIKAKRRAIYASTNLKKNYYTTSKQYLQNRCKTFDQKAFNFLSFKTNTKETINQYANPYYINVDGNNGPKPGSALALSNTYLANCQAGLQLFTATENSMIDQMFFIMIQENIFTQTDFTIFNTLGINSIEGFYNWLNELPENQKDQALKIFNEYITNPYWGMPLSGPSNPAGCQLVVYKPNNYQFAKQGAVDSSTRNLRLNVNTISTNAASIQNYNNTGSLLVSANELNVGVNPNLYQQKAPKPCSNTNLPLNFSQSGEFQNKRICSYIRPSENKNLKNLKQKTTYK